MDEAIEQLEQTTGQGWNIFDALEESATELEANPSHDSPYDNMCEPLTVTNSDKTSGAIRHIESELGFSSKSQSAQRLLRVGLQEMLESEDPELKDAIYRMKAYRDVVFKYIPEVGEAKFGYGALRETQKLPVDFGWDTKNREDSYSVFWNQKEKIRVLTDQLRVSESDIFQWGIVNAIVELGNEGLLDEAEARRAEETQLEIIKAIKQRQRFTREAALNSISRAYGPDSHGRVASYCSRNVPDLWGEFKQRTYGHHQALKENDPTYGNPFMYTDTD